MKFKIDNGILKLCSPQKGETEAIVPEGIHEIGSFAFSCCDQLNFISIPEGVLRIGELAFQGCQNLQSIVLPDELEEIDRAAFSNCRSITSIVVPESVRTIGDSLFFWCTSLQKISLPSQIKIIPFDTFLHCQNLQYIDLPDATEEIGFRAFSDCRDLKSITLPKNVRNINSQLHGFCVGCPNLETINVSQESDSFQSIDGILYNSDGTELIRCPEGYLHSELVIPEGVKIIHAMAFLNCSGLKKIWLPNSLRKICWWAFGNCKDLNYLSLSGGLETIENDVFSGCEKLMEINLPESITNIAERAFKHCPAVINGIPKSKNEDVLSGKPENDTLPEVNRMEHESIDEIFTRIIKKFDEMGKKDEKASREMLDSNIFQGLFEDVLKSELCDRVEIWESEKHYMDFHHSDAELDMTPIYLYGGTFIRDKEFLINNKPFMEKCEKAFTHLTSKESYRNIYSDEENNISIHISRNIEHFTGRYIFDVYIYMPNFKELL